MTSVDAVRPYRHADATPLLLTHGWPGSIVEFLDLIPRLINMSPIAMAQRHVVLMSRLGYSRYIAQGGGLGTD